MFRRAVCLVAVVLSALFAVATSIFAEPTHDLNSPASSAGAVINSIQTMHQHPLFWTVGAASIGGWLLGIVKGFNTSADFIKRYWRRPYPLVVLAIDLLVFAVGGAYVGTGIYNPKEFVPALAAGVTWPIAFAALTTRDARGQRRSTIEGNQNGSNRSNNGSNGRKPKKRKKKKAKKVAVHRTAPARGRKKRVIRRGRGV
jgi:hypothetical protein